MLPLGEYYCKMDESKIVTYGNDILRAKAEDIQEIDQEIRDLIPRMYQIMYDSRGVGLAGPQIGISKRIFVYDIGEGPHALINPNIVKSTGEVWGIEGCLSIPGLQGEVPRADRITVTGLDENGEQVKINAEDYLARVFQHEIDHLDGMMFIDRADPETLETVPLVEKEEDEDEELDS